MRSLGVGIGLVAAWNDAEAEREARAEIERCKGALMEEKGWARGPADLPKPTVTVMRALHSSGSVSFHCPSAVLDTLEDGDTLYTAEQVRAAILAEREANAIKCDAIAARDGDDDEWHAGRVAGAEECAAAIRRGSV